MRFDLSLRIRKIRGQIEGSFQFDERRDPHVNWQQDPRREIPRKIL